MRRIYRLSETSDMTESATRPALHVFSAMSLAAGDGILQTDGTLWSHAATLGTRVKGTEFSIDRSVVENFVRVYASGYPQKVPVDYDHGSTTDDPEIRRARAMGKVPKAGDVLELAGVFGESDFTGALRTAAEKLARDNGRELSDPRNFGLWIRWRPTQKALQAIQAREYTELSIAFDDDYPHNTSGEGQGPTLLAVALLNLPFLDDMLPVAASRSGGTPAGSGNGDTSMSDKKALTLLAVTAAVVGKAVTDEDTAITELQALQPEIVTLRSFKGAVLTELGTTDQTKAIQEIKQLKADKAKLEGDVAAATKARVDSEIETTLKKYEKRLTVPLRAMMATQLRSELEKGVALDKTETVKALESMTELGITEQRAGGDVGGANASDDVKLDAKARELMQSNPRLKQLAAKDEHEAYKEALIEAERTLRLVTA